MSEKSSNSHQEQMQQVKEAVSARVAQANIDKGVVIVLTGEGKGKSSSGFGMAARCLGHGMKVGIVQFIKGKWKTGEQLFFSNQPNVSYFSMGDGFTWDTQDKEEDIKRAESCWSEAVKLIQDDEHQFVLLDEMNVVLSFGYLPTADVVNVLKNKPKDKHIVVTGRGAPKELLEIADTVSQVESPKHAFDNGIKAQRCIEF